MAEAESAEIYKFPTSVTIREVEKVYSEISQMDCSVIDVSSTASITTPAVQLFISLNKKLEDGGKKLKVIGASDAFISVFEALGLQNNLNQWSVK